MTFGRSGHCALGVPQNNTTVTSTFTTGAGTGGSPRRVKHFGVGNHFSKENSSGSAIAISASDHHSLVATELGHLYAFGLGKSGRLGTGDENHRPIPTRVLGILSNRKVISVAAALNHSIASTSDGDVFAWGSNRFGQLGLRHPNSNNTTTSINSNHLPMEQQRCTPRRIDELKRIFIIKVAAGDRHSVATSRKGEVYTWGDNRVGQCGHANSLHTHVIPSRVDALWKKQQKNQARKEVVIAISASELSTLLLCRPPSSSSSSSGDASSLPINSVYAFGHGNPMPFKIHFPSYQETREKVNPVSIACAKYHCAVVTSTGKVYTWGLHSDPLGTTATHSATTTHASSTTPKKHPDKQQQQKPFLIMASPQLVTGMLPENGGGYAVSVAASEHHTAVLTQQGTLYTWGSSHKNQVLGHDGIKFQPLPKKVPGIHRAVDLAVAKEHTILLIGTMKPKLNLDMTSSISSLQLLASHQIAKHVDLYNILPIYTLAERIYSPFLLSYCSQFLRLNLDGVLAYSKKDDLDLFFQDGLSPSNNTEFCDDDKDDTHFNPLLISFLKLLNDQKNINSKNSGRDWKTAFSFIQKRLPKFLLCHESFSLLPLQSMGMDLNGPSSCSKQFISLTTNMDLSQPNLVETKFEALSNAIRSTKKKLTRVIELEKHQQQMKNNLLSLTQEQQMKLGRKPLLEANLKKLQLAMAEVEEKMFFFNISCSSGKKKKEVDEKKEIVSWMSLPKENDTKVQVDPMLSNTKSESQKQSATRPKLNVEKTNLDRKELVKMKPTTQNLKKSPLAPHLRKENKPTSDSKIKSSSQTSKEKANLISQEIESTLVEVKHKCVPCNITCPDEVSLELHLSGRKHRNRLQQIEEEEKKTFAAKMMEDKKRAMLSSPQSVIRPQVKHNVMNLQPSTPVLTSKSIASSPPTSWCVGAKNTSFSSAATGTKKANSFKQILQEQEDKQIALAALHRTGSLLTAIDNTRKSKGSSSPHMKQQQQRQRVENQSTASKLSSLPLSAFVNTKGPTSPPLKKQSSPGSPWAKNLQTKTDNGMMTSLDEIQQEELHLKSKKISTASTPSKWYVDDRRDRSESFGAILEQQEKHQKMVEEQYEIEAQIYLEIQKQKEEQSKIQKGQNRNKKKNQNSANRKQKGKNQSKTTESGNLKNNDDKPNTSSNNKRKSNKSRRSNGRNTINGKTRTNTNDNSGECTKEDEV